MAPMAPHISCELWQALDCHSGKTVLDQQWPTVDQAIFSQVQTVEVAVQVIA